MAMAPPKHRRPGYNRRAQYTLFAAYLIAVAGVAGALILLAVSAIDPRGFSALRSIGSEVLSPVARGVDLARRGTGGGIEAVGTYVRAGSQNGELRREIANLRPRAIEADVLRRENARLRMLLALPPEQGRRIATARLIGISGSSVRRIAMLSAGAASGVRSGMTVRAPDGLVGRVIEVGPTTARVLLITDPDNVVPVARVRDGQPAFASGLADGRIAVRPISFSVVPFRIGDILVTSGSGGIYQPGTPFARIVGSSRDGAVAEPIADPSRAEPVAVMAPYQPPVVTAEGSVPPAHAAE